MENDGTSERVVGSIIVCCESSGSHLNLSSIIQTIMKLDSDLKENVLYTPMARSSMYPMPRFLSNKLATNADMT